MPEENLNPYDTPSVVPIDEPAGPVDLPPGPYGPYRDNLALSRWLVAALLLYAALNLFWAVVQCLYHLSVAATSSETLDRIVGGVEAASWATLATFVLFGVWIVRSGKNAWLFHQLKRRVGAHAGKRDPATITTTPGWCVGWYFIPLANLWKPCVAMREIVRNSTTGQPPPGYLIPFWWALWLLSYVGDSFTDNDALSRGWGDLTTLVVWMSSYGVNLALSVVAIQLVRTVTRMQDDSARHFSSMDPEIITRNPPFQDRLTGSFLDR